MQTKQCTNCGEVKGLNEFDKDKTKKYGVRSHCKICAKQYRQENKERHKQYMKKWHEENRERIKQYNKKRYEENREYYKQYNKKRYEENREYYKQYWKKRYNNDPIYKLRVDITRSINKYIQNGKSKRTSEILGCGYEQFYLNLGPRPDNAHLDHIVPQGLAQTDEEVYLLNHWSNFQWLSDYENISKGHRYTRHHKYQHVLRNHPEPDKIRAIVNRAKNEGFQLIKELAYDRF